MSKNKDTKMEIFYSSTVRGIVDGVNERGIQKEDIVQVVPNHEGFLLLYYK
jgi:hypothetical protein